MNAKHLWNRKYGDAGRHAAGPGRPENGTPASAGCRARVAAVVVMAILVISGCAQGYGRFAIDRQVERDFRDGVIHPEYQYYYSGRDTMPYAIIAIHRAWRVPSRYWTPFDPDPAQLMRMSGNIYEEVWQNPYGASIKAPNGEAIGLWYSNVFDRSVRVNPEERTVEILFTNPENEDRPNW